MLAGAVEAHVSWAADFASNQAVNMGAMSEEEVMISNQARNFRGRNGYPKARDDLGSASTVVVSALKGKISDPARRVVVLKFLAHIDDS